MADKYFAIFFTYAIFISTTLGTGNVVEVSRKLDVHEKMQVVRPRPLSLPYFLGGRPEAHSGHSPETQPMTVVPHTADGAGLSEATTGEKASFTIRLVETNATQPGTLVRNVDRSPFIYVRIANDDQVFIAEVEDNRDGTMTATYVSNYPGQYWVYIEEVDISREDCASRGRPIAGSPFQLTISGARTIDADALPVCGTDGDEDIESTFWRPGSWVSSNIASLKNGVLRDGWVFQPTTCVHDTFSLEDLLMLASQEDSTWLVVLGGSVQRGVFLTLVDMVLAQGQKDNFRSSAIEKCWGYADIRVGNLRLTYQDLRLYRVNSTDDSTVCNNEKLEDGSTHAFVTSCQMFLSKTLFEDEGPWPTAIFAPSTLVDRDSSPNLAISVLMDALPSKWKGKLMMVEHMSALGFHWTYANPTMTKLHDVGAAYATGRTSDDGITRMRGFQQMDHRTSFMSVFPMYQAKLFENLNTRGGKRRCYKGSQHFHYVSKATDREAYSGSKMVQSTITEMLANLLIAKAIGTKQDLYDKVANAPDVGNRTADIRRHFEMCTDCPQGLLPFHVKPVPEAVCETLSPLPGNAEMGSAWNNELCPDWCLATDPVDVAPTESGPIYVRICEARRDGET